MAALYPCHGWQKRYRKLMILQASAFTLLLALLAFYRQMRFSGYAPAILVTLAGLTVGYGLLLYSLRAWRTPADIATVLRFFLGAVALLMACVGEREVVWIFMLMVFASLGDWVDGRLATAYGATPQGAILDAETDQMLVFMLAVLGIVLGGLGGWLLLFPAYRYGYILLLEGWAIPADDPKPKAGDNFRGRAICAITQGALLANLVPSFSLAAKSLFSAMALALLTYSFVADIFYQFKKMVGSGMGKGGC
jgi:phosphatidylglycerophosphate synthase